MTIFLFDGNMVSLFIEHLLVLFPCAEVFVEHLLILFPCAEAGDVFLSIAILYHQRENVV